MNTRKTSQSGDKKKKQPEEGKTKLTPKKSVAPPKSKVPEVSSIVSHILNKHEESATWIVQMRDDPEGVTRRVDGLFFYDSA